MAVGTIVYYKNSPNEPLDLTIGIITATNHAGLVMVEWSDNIAYWMNPLGLIKV